MTETQNDEPAFSEAMAELETILGEIEAEDVDLDALAGHVERASELIKLCRTKIRRTEERVHTIIADLEEDS